MQSAGGHETHLAPRRRCADICAADSSRISQASAPAMCEKCPGFRDQPGWGARIRTGEWRNQNSLLFLRYQILTTLGNGNCSGDNTTSQGLAANLENQVEGGKPASLGRSRVAEQPLAGDAAVCWLPTRTARDLPRCQKKLSRLAPEASPALMPSSQHYEGSALERWRARRGKIGYLDGGVTSSLARRDRRRTAGQDVTIGHRAARNRIARDSSIAEI